MEEVKFIKTGDDSIIEASKNLILNHEGSSVWSKLYAGERSKMIQNQLLKGFNRFASTHFLQLLFSLCMILLHLWKCNGMNCAVAKLLPPLNVRLHLMILPERVTFYHILIFYMYIPHSINLQKHKHHRLVFWNPRKLRFLKINTESRCCIVSTW
jgi:hypothetical protein